MKSALTSAPLRVAIIGAGQVADKVHASYYCTRNDLELVAVCDSRLSQARLFAENTVIRRFGTIRKRCYAKLSQISSASARPIAFIMNTPCWH